MPYKKKLSKFGLDQSKNIKNQKRFILKKRVKVGRSPQTLEQLVPYEELTKFEFDESKIRKSEKYLY